MEFITSKERRKRARAPFPVALFSGYKGKRIKQKTNPVASNMKVFVALAFCDWLIRKQLNNITKNPTSDVAGALDLPLCLVF